MCFVRISYQTPAFDAFDDFSDRKIGGRPEQVGEISGFGVGIPSTSVQRRSWASDVTGFY
jgi:hypothetical protein